MSYTGQYQEAETLVQEYIKTKDTKIKEKAIKKYLPLVKYIVGRINLPRENVLKKEDLNQYGIVGLLDSIERYDPSVGVTFKTFAYKRIHGEIVDAIRKSGVLSRSQMTKISRMTESVEYLKSELGREPLPNEICDYMGITLSELHKIQNSMTLTFTLSLDEKIGGDSDESFSRKDLIPSDSEEQPDVQLQMKSLKEELKFYIRELPERERIVLALYYYEELTLSDIGQVLNISESRVSQIMNKTLLNLQQKLKN
ncbi:MAG: FliA/WhiG family RNA polymerase sigma factor [Candidatus Marinimicrobia bacterium]|nr:FliA/WhiG family RNA polymerase sigma factor [Candidatus Neomarinimicrobiota bacterium]